MVSLLQRYKLRNSFTRVIRVIMVVHSTRAKVERCSRLSPITLKQSVRRVEPCERSPARVRSRMHANALARHEEGRATRGTGQDTRARHEGEARGRDTRARHEGEARGRDTRARHEARGRDTRREGLEGRRGERGFGTSVDEKTRSVRHTLIRVLRVMRGLELKMCVCASAPAAP